MTRALVVVTTPQTAAKSRAMVRLITGLVSFLWGVLLGGFATYWAPGDGDTPRSHQRAELCIVALEDVRSQSSAVEAACRQWLAEHGKEKGPHVAAR